MESTFQSSDRLSFRHVLNSYISYLMSQYRSIPYIVEKLDRIYDDEKKSLLHFIDEKGLQSESSSEIGTANAKLSIPCDYIEEYDVYYTGIQNIVNVSRNLMNTQFVDCITQFDNYLQNLMRCIYRLHPEILKNSNKSITYKELFDITTIDNAKDFVIESVLTELFHGSHSDQFEHFLKITKINVPSEMEELYKKLIEITERRNIHIHCHGRASRQYISVCTQNKVEVKVSEGDELKIEKKYFLESIDALMELSVKIGYIVWKKQEKSEQENADKFLISLCNDLIKQGRNKLAIALIDYVIDHKDNKMNLFNKHLLKMYWICAQKKEGNTTEYEKGIHEDWSSVKPLISLILSVLKDEFDSAVEQVKHIGNDPKELDKSLFEDSVLFSEFVKQKEFKETYKSIYNTDFCYSRMAI